MKFQKIIQTIVFPVIMLTIHFANGQTFNIGSTTITFYDEGRNNRPVQTQIFYPSVTGGSNSAIAEGTFPVIAFGHGFIMVYSAYEYLWEAIVPEGYIMLFPTTEGSALPAPDHLNFGLDLKFLVDELKSENLEPGSPFFSHIANGAAIMGHSMGGGASFLACENITDINAMITLAAAETNPSAINAALNIGIPTLVFSGSDDCVTPEPDHQVPMYNNLQSNCKTWLSITGGGHCYFANYNFNCSLGELFCNPSASITRQEQHNIVLLYLLPYLDYMLKGNQASWITFNNLINYPNGVTADHQCDIKLLDLKLLLEGPFNGMEMNTNLATSAVFPLSQPYSGVPWNYTGSESLTSVPEGVVDWILIELRDASSPAAATSSSAIARTAALLKSDGSVSGLDGFSFPELRCNAFGQIFVVISHRNHLSVMSASGLTDNDGVFSFDFTTGNEQAYGINAQKDLVSGKYGLYSGDFNSDGMVNVTDMNTSWKSYAGRSGYIKADGDLDGQADNPDKNNVWLENMGKTSQVPD